LFGDKPELRLVGCLKELMEYGLQVNGMLKSSLMVVLFLHIKIMWIATVEISKKGNVDSPFCHPPTFPCQDQKGCKYPFCS
jgi:hypothetical protein